MPTTITSSVGSGGGRDYSTIAAALAACPSDLTVADQIWRMELYNDSAFTADVTFPAITCDATRYVELTAAAGQSFQDHADKRTNRLVYDQTKGVGLTGLLGIGNIGYLRVSRLQFNSDGDGTILGVFAEHLLWKDCIVAYSGSNYGGQALEVDQATCVNVVIAVNRSTLCNAFKVYGSLSPTSTFVNCAAVRPSNFSAGGTAFSTNYGTPVLRNCAAFGFTNATSGGPWSGGTNATNLASGLPGTANQHSVTWSSTTPFVQGSSTSSDFRPVASSALDGNGLLDSTNAPDDITGLARPASPTIGVWQLASAAVASIAKAVVVRQAVMRASTF